MTTRISSVLGGVGALAIAGGLLIAGASAASAAPPTFEPDPNAVGTVGLYDASGNQLTSGSLDSHPVATYFAASGAATTGSPSNPKATPYAYIPQDGVNPANWSGDTLGPSTSFGTTVSSSYPGALANSANAIAKAGSTDFSLNDILAEFTPTSTLNPNVVEIRVYTGNAAAYYDMDVKVDTTANTWTQVYPTVAAKVSTSISAISATPATPAPSGTTSVALSATLSAADASHPGGTVHLFDGTTDKGAATLDPTTGAISATATVADGGNYSYTFVYTAAGNYTGTTSPALAYHVKGAASATSIVTGGSPIGTVGTPQQVTATVSGISVAGAGKVQFTLDGANLGAAVPVDATGAASQTYTPADASAHTIKSSFIPTDPTVYAPSSDATGITITASAPANAPDPQNVDVVVPAGSLVISTPYTPAHPFHLGTMALSADGSSLSTAPVKFGDPAAPAATDPGTLDASVTASTSNGVTITDTRPGSTGWAASASTTDFVNGANSIDGNDLSFSNVAPKYLAGNALQAGSVTTYDITKFKTPQKFAETTHGPGTVNITGTMSLTGVPTSTKPGTYTATVTFTIV